MPLPVPAEVHGRPALHRQPGDALVLSAVGLAAVILVPTA